MNGPVPSCRGRQKMWIDLMRTASDLKSATAYTAELSVSSQKFSGKDHRKLSMHASASLQCCRVGCNWTGAYSLKLPWDPPALFVVVRHEACERWAANSYVVASCLHLLLGCMSYLIQACVLWSQMMINVSQQNKQVSAGVCVCSLYITHLIPVCPGTSAVNHLCCLQSSFGLAETDNYTLFHKKTTPYLIAHNFGKCWLIFKKKFTLGLSRDRVMNWSLKVHHTLKASIPYLVKCKCQETTDNLKQMSRLTINFNLIYYS